MNDIIIGLIEIGLCFLIIAYIFWMIKNAGAFHLQFSAYLVLFAIAFGINLIGIATLKRGYLEKMEKQKMHEQNSPSITSPKLLKAQQDPNKESNLL